MLESLTRLTEQKSTLEIQRRNIAVLTNDIQNGKEVIGGIIGVDNTTDQVLVGLVSQLNDLSAQRRQMLLSYSPESSQVKNLDQEIASLQSRIVQSAQIQQKKNKETIQVIDSQLAKINDHLRSIHTADRKSVV